jgi:transposase
MGPRRVELFAAIRFDWQRNQMPVRALARKYDVHRRTVRQAIASPVPPDRKTPQRAAVVVVVVVLLDGVRELIDAMLREDLTAPSKQRHTARRVFERLCDEHGAHVSYSYVAKYVHRRRPEIAAEGRARAGSVAGFVPQAKEPGEQAEVDFGEVTVCLAGEMSRCYMFAFRLSFSGRACHRVFASQAQEAFLEGHVAAFEAIGGVPSGHVRYDNLSPAVAKVLTGRNRAETGRWLSFRAHYGFEAFYCIPGRDGAHEKGGVEGEIGRFRRRWFVPVPKAASLAELNARLAEADAAEDARHIDQRAATVGEDFAAEAPFLLSLPSERSGTARVLWLRADRYVRITVGKCRYSVPARLTGARVRVKVSASQLEVFDGSRLVAVHPRLAASGAEHLVLDHYLEILLRKPGALPGAAALAQARASGAFTPAHQGFWDRARSRLGDSAGTRVLIEVLLLHRRMPAAQVAAGIAAALQAGSVSPDVVAIEARKHAAGVAGTAGAGERPWPALRPRPSLAAVVTLPHREARLPADARPAPSVAAYDQLLTSPPAAGAGSA